MALTIAGSKGFINVTFDGNLKWDVTSGSGLDNDLPNGVRVKSIQIIPAATNDVFTVRDGGATGIIIYKGKAADAYDHFIKYFNHSRDKLVKLYCVGNQMTTGVVMIVEI
jgi:hypothetical protein